MNNKNKFIILLLLLLSLINCDNKYIPVEMILVEKGVFIMGNNNNGDEKPAHKVEISRSFYIGKYEITFNQIDPFFKELKRNKLLDRGWGRSNRPAIGINWICAIEFCNWLSKKEGFKPCYRKEPNKEIWECDFNANGYRLPTEAEWEYAAKGGNKSNNYIYSGSNDPDEVAWYSINSESMIHPVGQKKPNELGIYDMSGNVMEWCWDWMNKYSGQMLDPEGPEDGYYKVLRGGSWKSSIKGLEVTFRKSDYINPNWTDDIGFRIIRNSE